jgi:hypothetical protein
VGLLRSILRSVGRVVVQTAQRGITSTLQCEALECGGPGGLVFVGGINRVLGAELHGISKTAQQKSRLSRPIS